MRRCTQPACRGPHMPGWLAQHSPARRAERVNGGCWKRVRPTSRLLPCLRKQRPAAATARWLVPSSHRKTAVRSAASCHGTPSGNGVGHRTVAAVLDHHACPSLIVLDAEPVLDDAYEVRTPGHRSLDHQSLAEAMLADDEEFAAERDDGRRAPLIGPRPARSTVDPGV